jgi:endonuclease/exonuclease/phosphatase family metal-dependent hydrolase
VTRHPRIVVLTWNLFHGRDHPPNPDLDTWRSRLLRVTERDATHAQVNRPLRDEFASVLAGLRWDVALLQEAPPGWLRPLAEACDAGGASALTSRNLPHALRAWLARLNPDLMASAEGGSNQLLVRPPWRIEAVERETIARRPERRRMLLARLADLDGRRLAVANLHASTGVRAEAAVVRAAQRATKWGRGTPLVFGGDFNLRPRENPALFDRLRDDLGLREPTGPDALDHLLARGVDIVSRARQLAPEERDVAGPDDLRIRLSDHAPVVASFGMK